MESLAALLRLLLAGGWSMLPLLGCSMIGAAATFHLLALHARARIGRRRLLDRPLPVDDLDELIAACEADRSVLGEVMARVARARRQGPLVAQDTARRAVDQALDGLEGGLTPLAFIAQAAPLFGLLGTVVGMVDLFSAMEAAGDKVGAATLASGIWKALITTATGLCIAIPALGLHLFFSRRLDRLALRLEEGMARVLEGPARAHRGGP